MAAQRYRRKQDGHTVGPLTVAEMKGIAGFAEGEWEPVVEFVIPDKGQAEPAPAAPKRAPKRKSAPKPKKPTAAPAMASEPVPAVGADEGSNA